MQWNYYKKVFADTWIRSLKADTILQISDTQIPGLYLRYYPSTKNITFYLGYMVRKTKTHRNLCLGKYGIFTLKEIRKRALDYRQQISEGQDPVMDLIAEQKRKEEERVKRIKITDLLDMYFEKHCKVYKKTSSQRSDVFIIKNIKAELGELFIADLDLPKLIDFYQKTADRTSFSTANHYIALISNFWNWCETYKYLPLNSNPCNKIPKGKNKKLVVKPLTLDEYKRLLDAIDDGFMHSQYNPRMFRALKVLMLTGCRTTAAPNGNDQYVHYANGGWSWMKPYEAGLYVLAKQVKKDVTPEEFFKVGLETGTYSERAKCVLVNPVALIEALKK